MSSRSLRTGLEPRSPGSPPYPPPCRPHHRHSGLFIYLRRLIQLAVVEQRHRVWNQKEVCARRGWRVTLRKHSGTPGSLSVKRGINNGLLRGANGITEVETLGAPKELSEWGFYRGPTKTGFLCQQTVRKSPMHFIQFQSSGCFWDSSLNIGPV